MRGLPRGIRSLGGLVAPRVALGPRHRGALPACRQQRHPVLHGLGSTPEGGGVHQPNPPPVPAPAAAAGGLGRGESPKDQGVPTADGPFRRESRSYNCQRPPRRGHISGGDRVLRGLLRPAGRRPCCGGGRGLCGPRLGDRVGDPQGGRREPRCDKPGRGGGHLVHHRCGGGGRWDPVHPRGEPQLSGRSRGPDRATWCPIPEHRKAVRLTGAARALLRQ
mmetsp:Transcript_29253/g.93578  ORF Transcript_29253/g.93578 Transcript_29253/m.93578 type:complete len:220 (+) Transcript_29253:2840-3499(+)